MMQRLRVSIRTIDTRPAATKVLCLLTVVGIVLIAGTTLVVTFFHNHGESESLSLQRTRVPTTSDGHSANDYRHLPNIDSSPPSYKRALLVKKRSHPAYTIHKQKRRHSHRPTGNNNRYGFSVWYNHSYKNRMKPPHRQHDYHKGDKDPWDENEEPCIPVKDDIEKLKSKYNHRPKHRAKTQTGGPWGRRMHPWFVTYYSYFGKKSKHSKSSKSSKTSKSHHGSKWYNPKKKTKRQKPKPCPTKEPTKAPFSPFPSMTPTNVPSLVPSDDPTNTPSTLPSVLPSSMPSMTPSQQPSIVPSSFPTLAPSFVPSPAPTAGTLFTPVFSHIVIITESSKDTKRTRDSYSATSHSRDDDYSRSKSKHSKSEGSSSKHTHKRSSSKSSKGEIKSRPSSRTGSNSRPNSSSNIKRSPSSRKSKSKLSHSSNGKHKSSSSISKSKSHSASQYLHKQRSTSKTKPSTSSSTSSKDTTEYDDTVNGAVAWNGNDDDGQHVSHHVALNTKTRRNISPFLLTYMVDEQRDPAEEETDALVAQTDAFLSNYFATIFDSAEFGVTLEFINVSIPDSTFPIVLVDNAITVSYTGACIFDEDGVVPTELDLNVLTRRAFFMGDSLDDYLDRLYTQLPSANVFGSTTAVTFEAQRPSLDEQADTLSSQMNGTNTNDSTSNKNINSAMLLSVMTIALIVATVAGIFMYQRRSYDRRDFVKEVDGESAADSSVVTEEDGHPRSLMDDSELSTIVEEEQGDCDSVLTSQTLHEAFTNHEEVQDQTDQEALMFFL